MKGLPIICCHIGPAWYLPYVLVQARLWNPTSDVYLIGDQRPDKFPYVKCVDVASCSADAFTFAHLYQHLSTGKVSFELVCIQRWLAIREFVQQSGFDRVFVMDSDVLLFCDVTKEDRKYAQYEFTLNCGMGAGDSYFSKKALNDLADWILDLYTKKQGLLWSKTLSDYEIILKHEGQGGISDMYLLRQFAATRPWQVGESMKVIDGACFDHNFNSSLPAFKMIYGVKHIEWQGPIPTCWCDEAKQQVRLLDLHFQGSAKANIADFYTEPDDVGLSSKSNAP